uniref:Carbamoyl phosphate synthase small chain n=1 Tax=Erythroglossum lusitanicum TaxID=2575615 RepID=A0A4D6WRN9_9FLOR|nr:Carbamoyl phosphate synthase small subunit [Erythroglossum lusitanicum]
MSNILHPAVLQLEDGSLYKGWSFFKINFSFGEIVFNTGMTGYQEIITDPSYSNQIMVFTYPELGNTGLNHQDSESKFIHVKGIIAKNISLRSSNWRSNVSLKDYICNKRIPHIFGIDTRSLTKYLRSYGSMSAYIFNKVLNNIDLNFSQKFVNMTNLVQKVTTKKVYHFTPNLINIKHSYSYLYNSLNLQNYFNYNILLIDFGVKSNIINKLLLYGCNIFIVPATFTYNMIMYYKPDGIILSNGPGDPCNITYSINTIKKLIKFSNIPILGICMGHQLLSLAYGASTFKLKFGHRGLNHPSGINQFAEITSQNHGFAVNIEKNREKFEQIIKIMQLNLNDLTLAGIRFNNKPIISIQYHPEASPGPHDSDYLFGVFIKLIYIIKNNN